MEYLLGELLRLVLCVGFLLLAINIGGNLLGGTGKKIARRTTNAVTDLLIALVLFPLRAITWVLRRLFS